MLSVVIPTHNDVQCLELTLRSLSRQTLPRDQFEVVVIKDGPLPGYEGIEQHGAGIDLRVETLPQNLGRSGARNAGVARAHGDIVLFLDADGYADRELLARHAAFHAESGSPRVLLGKRYEIDWPQMAYLLADEPVPAALLAGVQDLKFANLRPEAVAGCMQPAGELPSRGHDHPGGQQLPGRRGQRRHLAQPALVRPVRPAARGGTRRAVRVPRPQ